MRSCRDARGQESGREPRPARSASSRPYLQRGQQPPDAATFVAAAAVVPNNASTIAIKPTSFAFIVVSSQLNRAVHPLLANHGKGSGRPEGQALDLQVGLKVLS